MAFAVSSLPMRWTIHGERSLYDSEWVKLHLADVELPDGKRFEHHLIRAPMPATGVVVRDGTRGVLLLWRHRFITDTWGWEIPAGMVEQGETIVYFVVGVDGRLGEGPRVVKSSGFEEFDSAAMRAVRQAAPFPPMTDPRTARPRPMSMSVTFDNPVIR